MKYTVIVILLRLYAFHISELLDYLSYLTII